MSYSTIYDLNGHTVTDGVQSQKVCDATINTARSIARDRGRSVVVEDRGTRECYRVTPGGHKWRAPAWWIPKWAQHSYNHGCGCTTCARRRGRRFGRRFG